MAVSQIALDDTTRALVDEYAQMLGISFEAALKELLSDGIQEVKANASKALLGLKSSGQLQ